MSGAYVLLQFSADPCNTRFEDLEGRLAFTVKSVEENPNLILKLTREEPWTTQHPDIMGPSNSFFYFGPSRSQGFLIYGNGEPKSMADSRTQKKEASTSRYFSTVSGKEYKWRISSPAKLECVDSKGTTVAVWEASQLEDEFHARLTVKHAALPVVTEILTTLTLNRIAQNFNW